MSPRPEGWRNASTRQQIYNYRTYDPQRDGEAVPVTRKTPFGNPFRIGKGETREQVIEKFRHYFYDRIKTDEQFKKDVLKDLRGKHLLCWCAPFPCHAEVIREWLEQREWNLAQRRKGEVADVLYSGRCRRCIYDVGESD